MHCRMPIRLVYPWGVSVGFCDEKGGCEEEEDVGREREHCTEAWRRAQSVLLQQYAPGRPLGKRTRDGEGGRAKDPPPQTHPQLVHVQRGPSSPRALVLGGGIIPSAGGEDSALEAGNGRAASGRTSTALISWPCDQA
ncbi:hypothetical protein B0H17DRAFT_1151539 [Mycena rosella]|uniref:Uncharacterized protein n=1 Tax=Mycena rosella TaxID=1033263 RepID=A0AAD7FIT5_MYCRO|nr:hypothetical protein B0H17DRAFT_1151539 [Mycena rosella]